MGGYDWTEEDGRYFLQIINITPILDSKQEQTKGKAILVNFGGMKMKPYHFYFRKNSPETQHKLILCELATATAVIIFFKL